MGRDDEIRSLRRDAEAKEREEKSKLQFQTERDDALAKLEKYEATGLKCNAGHVNNLPLKLWTCPMCCDRDIRKVVAADQLASTAEHVVGVIGLENSLEDLERVVDQYRKVK